MRVGSCLVFAFVLVAGAAPSAQPPAGTQYRCEVGTTSRTFQPDGGPDGARMAVLNDGVPCTIINWSIPEDRRNAKAKGEITVAAQHGIAVFEPPTVRYTADRGYIGADSFTYRSTTFDAQDVAHVMTVRVEVDVRGGPFDRTPGLVVIHRRIPYGAPPMRGAPPAGRGNATAPSIAPSGAYRVGNGVSAPTKVKDAKPVYPAAAMSARVQGTVFVEITLGADGKVNEARVTRSVPMLDDAALAAVRQWEFTPATLDGRAVPVVMTATVSFSVADPVAPALRPPSPGPVRAVAAPVERPATLDADLETAFQLLQQRQFESAMKAFRDANDRRGRNCSLCYMGLARAFESLGAAKNVVDSCDRALAIEKTDTSLMVQARQLKAIALQDLGPKDPKRLRDAEDELRAALAIDPAANYLRFNLGVVLLRQGRDTDGVTELNAELALRPASPHADRARKMIENPRRAREAFAPDFSIVTMEREFMDLAGLRGKVVLLDFWGTWCPPCVRAVPALRGLHKRHADDNFVMLSVSSDSDEAVVRRFTDANAMRWPQYWDRDRKIQQAFDVRAYPTYVLIDADGVIRFRTTGGGPIEPEGLDKAIKTLLKAAAGRPSKGE